MSTAGARFGMHRAFKKTARQGFESSEIYVNGEKRRVFQLWKVKLRPMRVRERQQVTQDNVRLKRIRDRAKGVRFALGHGDLNYRKRKEMEQTLHNLELAAVAINRELKNK